MADNSFVYYKYDPGDADKGAQKEHSSFTSDVLSSGGSYCRDFTSNTAAVKCLLTGSSFINLDGTQAISIRASVRTTGITHRQAHLVAKTNADIPSGIAAIGANIGYRYGLRSPSPGNVLGNFDAFNGTTKYSSTQYGIVPNALKNNSTVNDKWVHLRMDVCPMMTTSGFITGDKIKLYTSKDAGSSWDLDSEITINSDADGFIPWGNTNNNRYGFIIYGSYIDNFEVYLSTGYA